MKQRVIEPELLDQLPQDDPEARRSRLEMLQVNAIMGNHRWIERMVHLHGQPDWRILELGAGDGTLSMRLLDTRSCSASALHAVDLAHCPEGWPAAAHWTCGNVLAQPLPEAEIIVANLFLHHFTQEQLGQLGARLAPAARLIVASEPARYWIHTVTGRLFCELAEFGRVQRFDLPVSVRAGFRGNELREALALDASWKSHARCHALGSYRFIAWR